MGCIMEWLKNTIESLLKGGLHITIKKDWPGDEKYNKIHPSSVVRTDAMDDIYTSLQKQYKCINCGKFKKQNITLKCTKCSHFVCKSCYTIINKKAWCKECLKIRKSK